MHGVVVLVVLLHSEDLLSYYLSHIKCELTLTCLEMKHPLGSFVLLPWLDVDRELALHGTHVGADCPRVD